MVDTGADVTILSEGSANAVKFNRDLQGVAGSSSAPLYNVRLRVETQPPFPATIAVAKTSFNLLSIRDISKVYNCASYDSNTSSFSRADPTLARSTNTYVRS
ncbi:MAG: hypothetical protein WCF07_06630 [Nitrososphaeraceae archaeon]